MTKETMGSEERYLAAINLEKPDRVPVAPLISTPGAATLLGLEAWKIIAEGFEAQLEVEMKAFDTFGGWDATPPTVSYETGCLTGLKFRLPEDGESEVQLLETENWTVEGYDLITEMGWIRFCTEHILPHISDKTPEEAQKLQQDEMENLLKFHAACMKRGAVPTFSTWSSHPFFLFSLTRSMVKFTEDLYYRPEKVDAAMKVAVSEYIELMLSFCKATNAKVVNCTEERAGGFFYPPKVFERFWWPYTMEIVDAFWSEGIVTWFHLDTCWDKNIPYFKQLPKGSAIIDLDGTTDIFAAKELLRGHLCIASDIHPTLLSLGRPAEVEDYCKKVIDEVGGDGGLILCTGCTVPGAVRPENFRAMIDTGKTYEFSKR